jgi:PAS domain S-box-containing protein
MPRRRIAVTDARDRPRLRRDRRRPRSSRTLITALILLLLTPGISLSALIAFQLSASQRAQDETENLNVARALSVEMDGPLRSAEAALEALSTSPALASGDLREFYRQCAAVAEQHHAGVLLFNPEGKAILDTRLPRPVASPRTMWPEMARASSAGATRILTLPIPGGSDDRLVAVGVPVTAAEGRYMLAMAFHPTLPRNLSSTHERPGDWTVEVFDRNGVPIARNRASEPVLGEPATARLKAAMAAQHEGHPVLVNQRGAKIYTAFTRSGYSGWTLALAVPGSHSDAALWRSLDEVAAGGLIIMLSCGGVALFAARRVNRGLNALSVAALALGRGEQLPQARFEVTEMADVGAALAAAAAALTKRAEERDRAEAALRASERRFRDIAEVAGDTIWEMDADLRFTYFTRDNDIADQLHPESVVGKTRWEAVGADPERDEPWRRHRADLEARRLIRGFRYRVVAPNGSVFHLAVSGKPFFDEAGAFLGYRGTATDETEMVAARERAERAEQLIRDAIESISEGFAFYDRDDRLVMCNEAYRRLYPGAIHLIVPGTRFEAILRLSIATGGYAHARGSPEEWIAERLHEHRELADKVEHQLGDGRWMMISERRTSTGGTAGLRIDITALKEAQAELGNSREHLARAQRISGVGSLERDYRTGVTTCSEELCRILGVEPEGFRPSLAAIMQYVHPDDRPVALRAAQEAERTGIPAPPLEYRILRPDGTVRTVRRENEIFRDLDGRPFRKIVTFLDITEARAAAEREDALQRQLIRAQRLEALGTLAGGVAHDLNNTLVPVLALAKIVRDDLPEDSPAREDMTMIVGAGERARELVKQILAFSRNQEVQKAMVDPAAVTREALRILRATLPSTVHIADEISAAPAILADAGQLQQVVVNLVTNAAQAIGDREGVITVALAGPAERPEGGEAGQIRLRIADTGCGMDAKTLDRVFEPFFTTKGVGEGTGLGLSVVHGIVSAHGGRIEVRSEAGEGTEFSVYLPIAADAAAAGKKAA